MVLNMYFYFPLDIDTKKEGYKPPSAAGDAAALAAHLNNPDTQAAGDDDDNNGGYNYNPQARVLDKFHADGGRDWIDILAWSHGVSCVETEGQEEASVQDYSFTKYVDKLSPLLKYATMRGESVPYAVLRICSMPKDGKMFITEYEMSNVTVTTVATGGSGGEDRLTENLTVRPKRMKETSTTINSENGEIISQSFADWDIDNNKGSRSAVQREVDENENSSKGKEAGVSVVSGELTKTFPSKGISIIITTDPASKKYKRTTLKAQTRAALLAVVCEKLKVEPAKVKKLYEISEKDFLVELEGDEDVALLFDGVHIFVEL